MIHEDLVAVPLRTEYNHITHLGLVVLSGLGCTDMTGAIRYFMRIDPGVRVIVTRNDAGVDTVYQREDDGAWTAIDGPNRTAHQRVRVTPQQLRIG
jgi:hypothetical protein